ncbi:MAG TPA: nucleotidyltransferase family protein [Gemmatimonadaceae bacterium]|nr:nucleotidyltransferase family protein [Gemmatimonadaceae bacterium]
MIADANAELVTWLCRVHLSEAGRLRVHQLLDKGIDWEALLRRSVGWDVDALVLSNLRTKFAGSMPAEFGLQFHALERARRTAAIAMTLKGVAVYRRLDAVVPTIVLKGPAVGVRAYGDPSLRRFGDVDFLVAEKHAGRARDFLLSEGFQSSYPARRESSLVRGGHALEFDNGSIKIDLHSRLLSKYLGVDLEHLGIWENSATIICAGQSIRALAVEHEVLFLCAHGAKHEWSNAMWISDLANIAATLTPSQAERILDIASELHCERLLWLGLHLAHDIFHLDLAAFDGTRAPDAPTAALVSKARERIGMGPSPARPVGPRRDDGSLEALGFWLRSRERLVDRATCVTRLIVETVASDGPRFAPRLVTRALRLARRLSA